MLKIVAFMFLICLASCGGSGYSTSTPSPCVVESRPKVKIYKDQESANRHIQAKGPREYKVRKT